MMHINEIIEKLKSLDLSTYPEEEIRYLFNQIGPMGSIVVTYDKGKSIMRARPNYDGEHFKRKSDFSYKPQEYNHTYQRASTPNSTMFYATSIPDYIEQGELDNMRIIGIAETLPFLREQEKSGFQKISFGRWYVEENINLLAIIHKDTYFEESNYTRELVNAYKEFSKHAPIEIQEKSLKFQTYLSEEFAKEDINGDFDYLISAIFSELALKQGYDGVIYPSVRVQGRGFNIAISPEATKKLSLRVAGECSVYKHKDLVYVGNDAIIELSENQEEFEMESKENHQEEILKKLGVNSIDDLI